MTTDRSFAAKFISCSTAEDFQTANKEFEMIKSINHPRIALLEDAFKTSLHTILVQEL